MVVQGPPSGSIPWFLTEGNTSPLATSSSPLRGTTTRDELSSHQLAYFWHHCHAVIKKYFWRRCRGGFFNTHQVPNHKSHLSALTLFAICLSFSSPPLHHLPLVFTSPTSPICRFIRLSFSFAVFLPDLFFHASNLV